MRTLPQSRWFRLAREILEKAGRDDVSVLAAAGTYQMLLSLVPIVLLAASIVGFIFQDDPEKAARWIEEIAGAIPGLDEVIGNSLQAMVEARLQAGLIGLVVLAWTGSALAGLGTHSLARIFDVPERPWYRKRPTALLQLGILGVTAGAAIVLTTVLPIGVGGASGVVGVLFAMAIDVAVFTAAYSVLSPPGGPPWRGHLPGAVMMAVAWTVLKLIGAWYTRYVIARATAVYGAIGAVFGVIAILSLASHAFLWGAELSSVLRRERLMGSTARATGPPSRQPPDDGGGTERS